MERGHRLSDPSREGILMVRCEEASEDFTWMPPRTGDGDPEGETQHGDQGSRERAAEAIFAERLRILDDERLSPRMKLRLLEANRRAMAQASGGRVFATESVVYALLAFGAIVIIVLACLTAFSNLPSEVTLSFTGTVVGGMIVTVAQKIGRL
jgi:hypothetical protein